MFLLVDEEFTVPLDLGLCVDIVWHFVEPLRGVQHQNLSITFLTLAEHCLCSSETS